MIVFIISSMNILILLLQVYVLNEQKKLAMVMGAKPIEIEEQVDDITT